MTRDLSSEEREYSLPYIGMMTSDERMTGLNRARC